MHFQTRFPCGISYGLLYVPNYEEPTLSFAVNMNGEKEKGHTQKKPLKFFSTSVSLRELLIIFLEVLVENLLI